MGATVFAVAAIVVAQLLGCADPVAPPPAAVPVELPDLPPDRLVVPMQVVPGSSFGALVEPWGLDAYALRNAALDHHDLARIRPEQELGLVFEDGHEQPVGVRFALDEDRVLEVDRSGDGWTARVDAVPMTLVERAVTLDIRTSLWEAGLDAGLRPGDLAALATVFEYEVDFNTEIREGARIAFIGTFSQADGRSDRLEQLHAVRFLNAGKVREAVRVEMDGRPTFWHPDGTSTIRAFLRSPLAFSRVTSGFNPRRYHPVLKIRRPHNGTDFGAPAGTPVRSVASGVVTYAGRNGGHGNFVKIKHDGTFETSYSHLSRISVSKGQRVEAGHRIGTVGSTGLATGPHLHFQMWRNGTFVDAMRTELPRGSHLPREDVPQLDEAVATWLPKVPALE